MTDPARTDKPAPFAPDWVSPPGDTVLDLLEERGWTQAELSERLGYSPKHVNQLIKGKVPLTEDAAIRLQSVFGAPVGFWLKREALFRERAALLEAAERHAGMVPWLDRLPVSDLMGMGVIAKRRIDSKSKPGLVAELLTFYGVASPDQWEAQYGCMEVAFRRSRPDQSDMGAISAWLRLGERVAEQADGPAYDKATFQAALLKARTFTTLPPEEFESSLHALLHEAGVTLVLLPGIPRAHVSGVARWLGSQRALIQLSLYGKTNDRFWFTLFHEAAHLLLHNKKSVFLDDPDQTGSNSVEEREANAWARDFLIPPRAAQALPELAKTKAAVKAFADAAGIHPGIVVGRLQHDGLIDRAWMNDLKLSFRWSAAAAR
jgi:HTH-type transcriptional regulator/antitoxin HigA